jgi:hypothetical protein
MAIQSPQGPAAGTEILEAHLTHLLSRGPGRTTAQLGAAEGGAQATAKSMQASKPIRLYSLALGDIVDEDSLTHAQPIGWRYLIYGDGPVAVADLQQSGESEPPTFRRLTRGPIAERLNAATLYAARAYDQAGSAALEPRMLEIPALYISALWLHGSDRDVYIPLMGGSPRAAPALQADEDFGKRVLALALQKRRDSSQSDSEQAR